MFGAIGQGKCRRLMSAIRNSAPPIRGRGASELLTRMGGPVIITRHWVHVVVVRNKACHSDNEERRSNQFKAILYRNHMQLQYNQDLPPNLHHLHHLPLLSNQPQPSLHVFLAPDPPDVST